MLSSGLATISSASYPSSQALATLLRRGFAAFPAGFAEPYRYGLLAALIFALVLMLVHCPRPPLLRCAKRLMWKPSLRQIGGKLRIN